MLAKVARSLKNSFGNIIEWYDFSLYGYFATVISAQFFPDDTSRLVALIATFGAFGAGFVARPLGSILFGRLGDRVGRHYAMNLAILCMAIPTITMAFLPDYSLVGLWAPLLLVAVRLVQGLSAGGQFGNLLTLTSEDEKQSYTGFSLGIAYATSVVGFLIASGVSYLTLQLVPAEWQFYAWRVPFAMGFFLLLLQLLFRETDHRTDEESAPVRTPMKQLMKIYPDRLTLIIVLATTAMVLYYLDITYMVTYMQDKLGLSLVASLAINTISVTVMIVVMPLCGLWSDLYGRRKTLLIGFGLLFFISIPMVMVMQLQSVLLIGIAECVLAIMTAMIQGVATPYYTEIFPPQVRASGCSIGFGFGASISGFAPMVAAVVMGWLTPTVGLCLLLLLVSFIGLLIGVLIPNQQIEVRREQATGARPSTIQTS